MAVRTIGDEIYIGEGDDLREPGALARAFKKYDSLFLGGTAVIIFLAVWEWAGTSGAINPLFTSAPSRVINAFIKLSADGELLNDIRVSSLEFLYGFGLAIL